MVKRLFPLITSLAVIAVPAPPTDAAGMIFIDPTPGGVPAVAHPIAVRPAGRPVVPPATMPSRGPTTYGLRVLREEIKVDINQQVAKTTIAQSFLNDTDKVLSGAYLFPLPEDATFSSFSLHIDGKPVEGKIMEATEARRQYEAIVRRLHEPGLLEYADYKTVRARIASIPPHGAKKVELEYTQVLKADNGLLKYSYPLKTEGETIPAQEVKISVKLASSQGLRTIWSPSHMITSRREGDHKASASYLGRNILPDKDFVLYYSVSDKDLCANLLTHKTGTEDGYFLLTLSPPVKAREVAAKDIIFVADTSASMFGKRIEQSKKALKYLVNQLAAGDRFNIVQFSEGAHAFKPAIYPASPENKKAALAFIEKMDPAGGTNIGAALKTAGAMLGAKDRPSYLILVTDGEPTVGETTVAGLVKTIDPKKDIRLFDFGVGYDVNTRILNRLAEENHGTSQYVEPDESLELALSNFSDKVKSPVLSDVTLNFDGVQVRDMYPRSIKDIFAGSQILILGRYNRIGKAVACKLSGTVNGANKSYSFPLQFEGQSVAHSYLPRLWAMRRIAYLTEVAEANSQAHDAVAEIVALSKRFGIITNYTSFLAYDSSAARRQNELAGRKGGAFAAPSAQSAPFMDEMKKRKVYDRSVDRDDSTGSNMPEEASRLCASSRPPSPYSRHKPDVSSPREGGGEATGGAGSGFEADKKAESEKQGEWGSVGGSLLSAQTGKTAVMNAKKLNMMKDSTSLDQNVPEAPQMKTTGDKTFYFRDGFWIDSSYDSFKYPKPKEVAFGSDEYFDLLKDNPEFSKYFALGKQLIIVHKGLCYRITSNK